jgi:uncharacterized membrane protein
VPDETPQSGLSENAASGLAYVTLIPAIIFLVVAPYNQNRLIRFHAWQSIFLCIFAVAGQVVLTIIPIVGWILLIPFGLLILVAWVMCLIKAFGGQQFELPIIGKFAAKQAGV